ncbi:hypothetical protein [Raineyella fluvialis]|uniref:CAAX protease self-immunity n=1 Tax=Raineyella fluvialis TaxID=2662261 RepID=A0A5Q2FDP2_9ACTN|nr:hypothetical protein [Raineyella fluvialis]QGF24491.1 hypothetical protein Rai3103_13465 [Raineyella fluvialis]
MTAAPAPTTPAPATAESTSPAQAWLVVAVLALPIALVVAADRLLVGWSLRDAGRLDAPTLAPLLGVGLVLLTRRRLPGLRTRFDVGVTPRVIRRSVALVLMVVAMMVVWNQLCLMFGWLPAPRIDVDAGLPFAARAAAYLPLAAAQELAWRGVVRPTLGAAHGWLGGGVGTGLVWGLLTGTTWRFGVGYGLLALLTAVGWSVMVSAVLEEMRHGQLLAAGLFQWALLLALFLLLPEESGVLRAAWVLALTALIGGVASAWVYVRSRRARLMSPYGRPER